MLKTRVCDIASDKLLKEPKILQQVIDLLCTDVGHLPVQVTCDLVSKCNHHSYMGAGALVGDTVVGFSWGRLYQISEMSGIAPDIFTRFPRLSIDDYCFHIVTATSIRVTAETALQIMKVVARKPICSYPSALCTAVIKEGSPSIIAAEKLGFKVVNSVAVPNFVFMAAEQARDINFFASIGQS
ncbi:hypothetical protein C4564_00435 [Candidatus Microgenomates bacterium]|nr:MAG: hypothetical protein C4564_00435 [Candidatus Microgenomates bacterium]